MLAIVSQIVQPCMSGAVAAMPGSALARRRGLDVAAGQQRALGELLGVEEVDLAGLEARLRERRLDHARDSNSVSFSDACHQPVERLLVQVRVVGEPDHHRAGVGVEVERRRCPRTAPRSRRRPSPSCRRRWWRVSENDEISRLSGFLKFSRARFEVGEDVVDGLVLVVLEGELHSDAPPGLDLEVAQVRLVEPHRLDVVGQLLRDRLEEPVLVGDDVRDRDGVACRRRP